MLGGALDEDDDDEDEEDDDEEEEFGDDLGPPFRDLAFFLLLVFLFLGFFFFLVRQGTQRVRPFFSPRLLVTDVFCFDNHLVSVLWSFVLFVSGFLVPRYLRAEFAALT